MVSRMRGQPLPNPANRPHGGVQQSVVPSIHLEDSRWRRERKGRECEVGVERIWAVRAWTLRDPREAVLRREDEVRY